MKLNDRFKKPAPDTSTKFFNRETILFLIAGIINTAVSFAIYSICIIYFDLDYRIAAFFSLLSGITTGFLQSRFGVFQSKNSTSLLRYLILWAALYFLSIWLIGLLMEFESSEIRAYLITILFSVPLSFFAQKYWVFRKSR